MLAVAVAAVALTVFAGAAAADDPPPSPPVYPPPGGVTDNQDDVPEGAAARAGGATFTYADLQHQLFETLWWGPQSDSLPKVALDGEVDAGGETLAFSPDDSNLGAGIVVFRGEAVLPSDGVTYQTRATFRTMNPDDSPLPMVPAAPAGLPPEIGGAAVIPSDPGDFKSNLLLEVLDGSWQPALDWFDGNDTSETEDGPVFSSIGAAFYYVPANELPIAEFSWDPQTPTVGREVTFTSTSSDPDGTIEETHWELDGDGDFDDATGPTATMAYPAPGDYEVGVRVVDDRDDATTATATLTVVPNEPPEASFTYSPQSPKALQNVTFTSTSTDSDGTITATAWDLDNDGAFDDATGNSASRTFPEAGNYTVGVQVTDDLGDVDTATRTVTVTSCERTVVSQTLRAVGAAAGIEPTVRSLNCDVLEPLGL